MPTKHNNIGDLKKKAVVLRLKGASYSVIEKQLGVSRSTLSGWLSSLALSDVARETIRVRKLEHLADARKNAVNAHKQKRINRVNEIEKEVTKTFNKQIFGKNILELILGALYLGEGFKKQDIVGLGNSNPEIVQLFVGLLRAIYIANNNKFRCILYLRIDQNAASEIRFWSKTLSIPAVQFGKTQFDKRTLGKKTYLGYHGVCAVYYYDADIAKRLSALQKQIIKRCAGV